MKLSTETLFLNHVCKECGYRCVNRRSAGNHVNRSHPELSGLKGYVLKHELSGVVPKCACDCGSDVIWHKTKYVYNEYVNGHNPVGFRVCVPKLTEEQLARRSESIRKTYLERGDEIKKKISDSIMETKASRAICTQHDGTKLIEYLRSFDHAAKLSDSSVIISRDQLIQLNGDHPTKSGPGREWTRAELLPVVCDLLEAHVAAHGWFYPSPDRSLAQAVDDVRTAASGSDKLSAASRAGSSILKSMFRSFWDVDGGPSKSISDRNALMGVVAYRLGLNGSKPYEYDLADGTHVSCRETFDVTLKAIRFGFVVQKRSVSFFKPVVAARIFEMFLSGIERPVVWDPSGGFGGRMLGLAAMFPSARYVCCEPSLDAHRDLESLGKELAVVAPGFVTEVIRRGSEKHLNELADGSADFVFTSPPYFDKERYVDEPGQCWRDFPDIDSWTSGYVVRTCENASSKLKTGGKMVLNVDMETEDVWRSSALASGFIELDKLELIVQPGHFAKKRGNIQRNEPVLVFEKI